MSSFSSTDCPMNPTGDVRVHMTSIEFSTQGNTDMVPLTEKAAEIVLASDLRTGILTLFVPGATGALTTVEYEPGVVADIRAALEIISPLDGFYEHNRNLGDNNGHAHVRAGLLGPSLVIPFRCRQLILGRYQDIVFCDFDDRPRRRSVAAQAMGV